MKFFDLEKVKKLKCNPTRKNISITKRKIEELQKTKTIIYDRKRELAVKNI
jgi:hypothetical protein